MSYQREASVENHLIRECKRRKLRCLKVSFIGRRGAPDRLISSYKILVELKAPKGKLRPTQIREHHRLSQEGWEIHTLHTRDQVDALMAELDGWRP